MFTIRCQQFEATGYVFSQLEERERLKKKKIRDKKKVDEDNGWIEEWKEE